MNNKVKTKKFNINIIIMFAFTFNVFVQFSRCNGGLKWTRTTDLTLIRRAL